MSFLIYNIMYWHNIGDYTPYGSIIWTVYSIATILFLLTVEVKNKKVKKAAKYLSSISYQIFFIHYFIIYAFLEYEKKINKSFSYWMAPVCFICSLGGSILIIEGWKKTSKLFNKKKFLIG